MSLAQSSYSYWRMARLIHDPRCNGNLLKTCVDALADIATAQKRLKANILHDLTLEQEKRR